ncbi:MAG: radical SAM protein [Anaerolineae bacterium]|jgi:biotin synthase|nr:radical SAM protein [Anaerolineae bacterium]
MTQIRLSTGSAVALGLAQAQMEAAPTTLYAMVGEACLGACRFCAQARDSHADRKFLSRIAWPAYPLADVLAALTGDHHLRRICFQTLLTPDLLPTLLEMIAVIHAVSPLPISVCMNPVSRESLQQLKSAGVERVGVGLDCATESLFEEIKPGFSWERTHRFLEDVAAVFGRSSIHLIVGLGESDEELLQKVQASHDHGHTVAFFAFTPLRGARLQLTPPPIERYRALQLARRLIITGKMRVEALRFEAGRLVGLAVAPESLAATLASGAAFCTSGCPDCNRPLYNERPGGVMYNFPRPLTEDEKRAAWEEVQAYCRVYDLEHKEVAR